MTERRWGIKWPRVLMKLLGAAGAALLLALLYVILILGQPQEESKAEATEPPPLSAGPAIQAATENELRELIAAFPAPVMSFMSGSGMSFVSAASSDTSWRGGTARTAESYWQTPEGEPMILQSIYPSALEIMGMGDYSFSGTAGPSLFGQASVRMENAETVRVHTVVENAVYVVTVPRSLAGDLSSLCQSIQLFTVD